MFYVIAAKSDQTGQDNFSDSALIVHRMYLKSTDHTLFIYIDFVLRSEWSLINIPGTMGVGSNKLLVVKELNSVNW